MSQPPTPIYNLTPEQIQQNIIASKNRLNAVQGQANGMISEAVTNELNGYGSIIIQLLQEIDRRKKIEDNLSKQLADVKPNIEKNKPKPK